MSSLRRFYESTRGFTQRKPFPLLTRLGAVVLCGVLVSVAWAQEEEETPTPVGLQGLLSEEPSEDITTTLFSLPENWQPWAEGVSEELAAFHDNADKDVAAQRATLENLRKKVGTVEKSLADPRYRSMFDDLLSLHGSMLRSLDVAEAALDTLEMDPAAAAKANLESSRTGVLNATSSLSAYLANIRNGDPWLAYVKSEEIVAAAQPGTDIAEARAQFEASSQKIKSRDTLGDVTKEFLSRPPFLALEKALDRYLAAADVLDQPIDPSELRGEIQALLSSVQAYEANNSSESSKGVREAFSALRRTAPDGGKKIAAALQEHYFNYNTRVTISESFLNKVVSETRTDSGAVRDFILGANVSGNQTTTTTVGLDLLPSNNAARFAITLDGVVRSNTAGATPDATIYTSGYHTFNASKEIAFDGVQFATRPATISVNANNTTTGATTRASGTIFARAGQNMAMSAARERKGQSEAIARSRVAGRVTPEFNTEVDNQFQTATKDFAKKVAAPLKELGLYPDAYVYQTTGDQLRVATRLMATGELGGDAPYLGQAVAGMQVQLHESVLNNSTDRLELQGKTMTEDELRALLEARLTKLLGREVKFPVPVATPEGEGDEKGPSALSFGSDPIRIRARNGQLSIAVQAAFKREGKEDTPPQVVTIPLNFAFEKNKLTVTRGDVSVSSVEKAENIAEQIALAGVIKKRFESSMPPRTVDSKVNLKLDEKTVVMTITSITALDGWLTINFE